MAHTILTVVSSYSSSVLSHLSGTFCIRSRRYRAYGLAGFLAATIFIIGGLKADATRFGSATKKEPAAIQDFSSKRLPVARIILSRKGFEPAEITRPKGPFILSIHNRSKIDDLPMSLSRGSGNKLREMNFHRQKLDWRSFITLPPGDYVLSVANHPEWVCKIKVKEN